MTKVQVTPVKDGYINRPSVSEGDVFIEFKIGEEIEIEEQWVYYAESKGLIEAPKKSKKKSKKTIINNKKGI